jgi:ankyrin repeat protein/predicted Ser/Thr protein kinase
MENSISMSTLTPGTKVRGTYRVLRFIGEGGMNRVYLVEDSEGERWALKETKEAHEVHSSNDEIFWQFEREISILTSLSHPRLPKISAYFSIGRRHYVVEEFIDGQSLEKLISYALPGPEEVIDLAIKLCEVLDHLHRNGIIFRDLKPANILVTTKGELKLIDFDIARYYKKGRTVDTTTLGTPGFAAPETYGASQSDARSDIYSLGATMHSMLTGIDPQDKPFYFESLTRIRADVYPGLVRIIEKALDMKAENRYKSARALKKALQGLRRPGATAPSRLSQFLSLVSTLPASLKSFASGAVKSIPDGLAAFIGHPSEDLLAAMRSGDWAMAAMLVKSLIDKNVKDELGRTLLHWAVISDNLDFARSLLDHGADANVVDSLGMTPLDWALFSRKKNCAELLVRCGADVNKPDSTGRTPLHRAIKDKDDECADFLIEGGANLKAITNTGWTPLHFAAYRGRMRIMERLLLAGAKIEARTYSGLTPLHCAAEKGNLPPIEGLLKCGANCGAKDGMGNTPLHIAAALGHTECAASLLRGGAAMDAKNDKGKTPLHCAASGCRRETASLLLHHGAHINEKDSRGCIPLHDVASSGDNEQLESIRGPEGKMSNCLKGTRPLGQVSEREMAESLIVRGADPLAEDNKGKTPLHYAIKRGCDDMVKLYVDLGITIDRKDSKGIKLLTFAVRKGAKDEIVSFLLEKSPSIKINELKGEFLLHAAAGKGQLKLMDALIKKGLEVNEKDRDGKTPLHEASSPEAVHLLAINGADLNALDNSGKTPLLHAVENERTAVAEKLLHCGADVMMGRSASPSLLIRATKARNVAMAKQLLDAGADPETPDSMDKTPLHHAVEQNLPDIVKMLLERKVKVNRRDSKGMTPLHRAVERDLRPLALMLIENKADMGIKNYQGNTPLALASSPEMNNLLLWGQQ